MATKIKINGLEFRLDKDGNVMFQNGMFSGIKFMQLNDFEQMVKNYISLKTRNGAGFEPKGNNKCDEEIYPA